MGGKKIAVGVLVLAHKFSLRAATGLVARLSVRLLALMMWWLQRYFSTCPFPRRRGFVKAKGARVVMAKIAKGVPASRGR